MTHVVIAYLLWMMIGISIAIRATPSTKQQNLPAPWGRKLPQWLLIPPRILLIATRHCWNFMSHHRMGTFLTFFGSLATLGTLLYQTTLVVEPPKESNLYNPLQHTFQIRTNSPFFPAEKVIVSCVVEESVWSDSTGGSQQAGAEALAPITYKDPGFKRCFLMGHVIVQRGNEPPVTNRLLGLRMHLCLSYVTNFYLFKYRTGFITFQYQQFLGWLTYLGLRRDPWRDFMDSMMRARTEQEARAVEQWWRSTQPACGYLSESSQTFTWRNVPPNGAWSEGEPL